MNGLNQVRTAVIEQLRAAGLTAAAAFDGEAKRYENAVVTVDVGAVTGAPAAMGSYLGQRYDAEAGTLRELYGRVLTVSLTLEVRAPAAADCETACETAADALTAGGLPSGLRLGEQSWDAACWERENRMFLRRGCVKGSAYFTAETGPEGETLLDFTLKGVLSN